MFFISLNFLVIQAYINTLESLLPLSSDYFGQNQLKSLQWGKFSGISVHNFKSEKPENNLGCAPWYGYYKMHPAPKAIGTCQD
jgi:hypothetical protein